MEVAKYGTDLLAPNLRLDAKQCAAVKTYLSLIRVAPHVNVNLSRDIKYIAA